MKLKRIQAIDATRGAAMLFVFVSHFGLCYFRLVGAPLLYQLSEAIGMVATPTFTIISGLMLGYLFQVQRGTFGVVRSRLLDRGLFYLLVGHPLIATALVASEGGWLKTAGFLFVTDMIGLCIIAGPPIIEHTSPKFRMGLGGLLYGLSLPISMAWNPGSFTGNLVESILFGDPDLMDVRRSLHVYTFPLIPWFAVYIAATPLGERIAQWQLRGQLPEAEPFLKRLSLGILGAGVLSMAFVHMGRSGGWISRTGSAEMLDRYQKLPPGPIYLLFYGGLGLAILYLLFVLPDRKPWNAFIDFTTMLGQTSFFVFILQYFVYFTLMYSLHPAYTPFWPAYLAGTVALMTACSWLWRESGYNRYLTLRFWSPGSVQ